MGASSSQSASDVAPACAEGCRGMERYPTESEGGGMRRMGRSLSSLSKSKAASDLVDSVSNMNMQLHGLPVCTFSFAFSISCCFCTVLFSVFLVYAWIGHWPPGQVRANKGTGSGGSCRFLVTGEGRTPDVTLRSINHYVSYANKLLHQNLYPPLYNSPCQNCSIFQRAMMACIHGHACCKSLPRGHSVKLVMTVSKPARSQLCESGCTSPNTAVQES
jgi:hypothetical protein